MNILLILSALLAGGAIACLIWAAKGMALRRYNKDVQWMRETYHRFHPEEINAELYTVLYYLGCVLLLLILLWLIPSWVLAVIFWIVFMFLPAFLIEWAWRRRVQEVDQQISQCVTSMANSMRAGLTLVQAMTRLSEQAPDPIKMEFKIMANQYGLGADMKTVLKNAKERLKLANFNLFASALLLNREMGGDVAETLTRISKSLDKLREMRKTVEAHTSEGRTNIKILLLGPVAMLLLMAIVDRKGVIMLFTTPQGIAMLMVAGLLSGTGVFFARKITRSDV
ncbi:MAG: type II secretion system F family protein [Phycisphaerales bacterium]|nr:type II secretion system F family protein [Phycisphaerales bacterium]